MWTGAAGSMRYTLLVTELPIVPRALFAEVDKPRIERTAANAMSAAISAYSRRSCPSSFFNNNFSLFTRGYSCAFA